jgi:hypothetical protein
LPSKSFDINYHEFVLELKGADHEKISDEMKWSRSLMAASVQRQFPWMRECAMRLPKHYIFGEFEETEAMMHGLENHLSENQRSIQEEEARSIL